MKIVIFGAGKLGTELGKFLEKIEYTYVFLDNDIRKQNTLQNGIKVWRPEDYLVDNAGDMIVIACAQRTQPVIKEQLKLSGLKNGKDYVGYSEFLDSIMPQMLYEKKHKVFTSICQITLTERCTLKCKKCAHGCYAVDKSSVDMTIEKVKQSADSFFSHIDLVYEFVLIGGEPLLYQDIDAAIQYIGENYRNQIHSFLITTNGTIIPKQSTMKLCKEYQVTFDISNYSKTLPGLKEKYNQLVKELKQNGVKYRISDGEGEWKDYGFETINRNASADELKKIFSACHTPCHEIRGNKLYYCVMARSVADNLHFDIGKDDYLDLNQLEGKDGRGELLRFILGDIEKGYLDMCNHCRGAEASKFPIPPAEQIGS